MGRDRSRSVVDEQFRVNGVQNLFIADSSIFPAAPGINPALTIMALAHRASQTLLEKRV
jgi:choline dehydrogenase-like flavoprotein